MTLPARWLTENRADTRTPGPPTGRRYAAPFADVWDGVLELIRDRGRWRMTHADEDGGLVTVRCRSLLFGFVDDLVVWVSLDRDGLTRVQARSRSRTGIGDLGVNHRRIERMLRELDGRFERV